MPRKKNIYMFISIIQIVLLLKYADFFSYSSSLNLTYKHINIEVEDEEKRR